MRSNGGRSEGRAQPQSGWNSCPPLISSSCRVRPALALLLLLSRGGRCTDFAVRLLALLPKSAPANMVSGPRTCAKGGIGSRAAPGRHHTHRSRPPPGILFGPASLPSIPKSVDPRDGPPNLRPSVRVGAVFSKASSVTLELFQSFLPRRKRRILLNTLEGGVIASERD